MNITDQADKLEPIDTLCDLVGEYGMREVLESLAVMCEVDADDKELCPCCRAISKAAATGLNVILSTAWAEEHEEEGDEE